MFCDVCDSPFESFIDAKRHHLEEHEQTGYMNCCGKRFSKLYRIMQHCKWHENPNAFE